jgi:hypothetical protein
MGYFGPEESEKIIVGPERSEGECDGLEDDR